MIREMKPHGDTKLLMELTKTKMPFGKYKGYILADLPTYYLEWFASKGFPKGKLGSQLAAVFEIKTNGLEEILFKLKRLS